jgi:hypothetical protein
MQRPRFLGAGLSLILLLAACSGSPAATQGPAGATTNPGGNGGVATTDPGGNGGQATTDPGGGGNVGNGSGKVTYELTGDLQKSGELPFFAFGSRFGGPAGTALNFTSDAGGALLSVTDAAGAHAVSLVVPDGYAASFGTCGTWNVEIGATSARGSFECTDGIATGMDGTLHSGLRIKGTFDASQ